MFEPLLFPPDARCGSCAFFIPPANACRRYPPTMALAPNPKVNQPAVVGPDGQPQAVQPWLPGGFFVPVRATHPPCGEYRIAAAPFTMPAPPAVNETPSH